MPIYDIISSATDLRKKLDDFEKKRKTINENLKEKKLKEEIYEIDFSYFDELRKVILEYSNVIIEERMGRRFIIVK